MKLRVILSVCIVAVISILFVSCGECEHSFGEWEATKAPTCIKEGVKTAYCTECNQSKTETIPIIDHSLTTLPAVEATCTEAGLTQGSVCSVCDQIIIEQKETPIIEHTYENGICSACGKHFASEGLSFTSIESNNAYKVSIGTCKDENVIIPPEYNGLPVTLIDSNAFNGCSFKSIEIPSSIVTIEQGAFKGCSSLEKITIPFVGKSADATGKEALFGYIFGDEEFDGSYEATQAYPSPYANATYVYDYYIPEALTEVVLIGGLTFGAFDRCTSLTSVTIPSAVTEIPNYSFRETSIASFYISENVTKIRGYAFVGCSALSKFTVNPSNQVYKSIDGNVYSLDGTVLAYYASGKTEKSFTVIDGVTEIGNYAFYKNTVLEEVIFPSSTVNIGYASFSDCSSLSSITLSEGIISIESHAFINCSSLANIVLPDSLEEIGSYAFQNCSSLKSVVVPTNVKRIEEYAFSVCSNLNEISLPANIEYVGNCAFWKSYSVIINCGDDAENENWHNNWNPSNCTVLWGEYITE